MYALSALWCCWVNARSNDVVMTLLTTVSRVGTGASPATTTRASLALYNTREEIDALIAGLRKVKEIFA